MRGAGVAAAAVAAVVVLAGCGGGSDERSEGAASASASVPAGAKGAGPTTASVRRDIRAAAGAGTFEGLRFVRTGLTERLACQLIAVAETSAAPARRQVERVAEELERRGWKVSPRPENKETAGYGYLPEKGSWHMDVIAGADLHGMTGIMIEAWAADCAAGSATPTP
ncbi:hypothetical protein [Streptomyces sp. enrichment culture]|uniref:hypothetical protein n=1 Tax=Streptomyces sp. enrichment culture TaxID=1795815 RepID=UPI003F56B6AB